MKSAKYLLVLNIPPPFGGGEIRAEILFNYFKENSTFNIITNVNESNTKATQGKITLKNILHNTLSQCNIAYSIIKKRPKVVYISIPKDIVPLNKILPIIFACKLRNTKLLGELAGSHFYFLKRNKFIQYWGKSILAQFYEIRLLGNRIKKDLAAHGITNTIVFDNGTDVPDLIERWPKKLNGDKISIVFIGALHKAKGIFILLEIVKLLVDEGIDFILNVVGEWGNEIDKKQAQYLISKNRLGAFINFHGLQKGVKKWEILNSSHFYVFPSLNEGQPVSIIEALSVGIPIISSSVGAIPDTIEDNINGYIINDFDANKYVAKIIALINDPKNYHRISQNNIETYQNRYTVEKYCNSVENWIKDTYITCNNSPKNSAPAK